MKTTNHQFMTVKSIRRFYPPMGFAFGVIFFLVGCFSFIKCKESTHEATSASSNEASASNNGQEKYVLIIYNNNEPGAGHDQEYEAWLKTIGAEHKAEWKHLHKNGWVLSPGPGGAIIEPRSEFPGSADADSYFIFEAKNSDDALNIAKTCPRLNYKGSIELRQIH